MARKRTLVRRIGMYIGDLAAYGRGVALGAAQFAHTRPDWILEFQWSEHARWIAHWRGDGLISLCFPHIVERCRRMRLPWVSLSDGHPELRVPTVCPDNRAVGQLAARHFIDRGFRNFAYLGFPNQPYSQERCREFSRALAEAGFRCSTAGADVLGTDTHSVSPAGIEWLASQPRPLAVLASNDNRARQIITGCLRRGLRIPEDIAVLGVDNDPMFCDLSEVPISSIALPLGRIGFTAAQLLANILDGRRTPAERVLLPPLGVVVRRSTDVLAVDDPILADALRCIAAHIRQKLTVRDIASELAVSRRALERRFRQVLARSPGAEIRRTRIQLARELLWGSDLSMKRIAAECGFTDAAQFTIAFRREMGQTPTAFRRQSRPPTMPRYYTTLPLEARR